MSARARHAGLVVLVALTGLALAVALATLTSRLTTQHVGLAADPARAEPGLVAPVSTRPMHTAPAATAPSDDANDGQGDD